jgi:hypothetical protein
VLPPLIKLTLAEHNNIQKIRVQGYKGIAGNKTADLLAELGDETPFLVSEPVCGISAAAIKELVGTGGVEST